MDNNLENRVSALEYILSQIAESEYLDELKEKYDGKQGKDVVVNIIPSRDISFKTRSLLSSILDRLELTNQDRIDLEKYIMCGGLDNIGYIKQSFKVWDEWKDKILNVIKGAPEEFENIIEIFNHIEEHIKDFPFEKGFGENSAVLKGGNNIATGFNSYAEGGYTKALSEVAHAEGLKTISGRINQLIDPTTGNIRELTNEEISILVTEALRIGLITTQSEFNNAIAMKLIGFASHAEGNETKALGTSSHAEGNNTEASSNSSHAEGDSTHACGEASHAEGYLTEANGNQSHSEGKQTKAQGNSSHSEGIKTTALKEASHAEGKNTIASGNSSHAEGIDTQANGWGSHAEGGYNITIGSYSHIEGRGNYIGDDDSYLTEVTDTNTKAYCAHSEGQGTKATGNSAHAEGMGTIVNNNAEHAEGKYNKSNDNTIHSVGIGATNTDRKNAHEIMQDGKHYIIGIGGYDGTNPTTAKSVQEVINELVNKLNEITTND